MTVSEWLDLLSRQCDDADRFPFSKKWNSKGCANFPDCYSAWNSKLRVGGYVVYVNNPPLDHGSPSYRASAWRTSIQVLPHDRFIRWRKGKTRSQPVDVVIAAEDERLIRPT